MFARFYERFEGDRHGSRITDHEGHIYSKLYVGNGQDAVIPVCLSCPVCKAAFGLIWATSAMREADQAPNVHSCRVYKADTSESSVGLIAAVG